MSERIQIATTEEYPVYVEADDDDGGYVRDVVMPDGFTARLRAASAAWKAIQDELDKALRD